MIIDDLEIKQFIINDTQSSKGEECCGIIIERKGKLQAIKCENSAKNKNKRFKISRAELNERKKTDKIVAFYHSHEGNELSIQDRAVLSKLNLKSIVCNSKTLEINEFEPDNKISPIVGRPFIAGVLDCVELVKDFYKKTFNIIISDLTHEIRTIEWSNFENDVKSGKYLDWNSKDYQFLLNFYLSNGFVEVSKDNPQDLDLLLFRFPFCETPTHVMIFNNDRIIHHPYEQDSKIEKYSKYYQKYSVNCLRYKDFL
jgi:proteasome lid subunit RPN8/RPN11